MGTYDRCIADCNTFGCPTGQQCDTNTGICVPDPVIDAWSLGGDDLLDGAGAAITGTATTMTWAATNADSTLLETAAVPASGDCADVAAGDWATDQGFPGTATGTYDVTYTDSICVRLTASGSLASVSAVAKITVDSCANAGCPSGSTCDANSGACVPDPTIDAWSIDNDDLLDGAGAVTSGTTASMTWTASNADSTTLETAAVPASDDCADVAAGDWTADGSFPGTATGTYDVTYTASTCVRLTATGPQASASAVAKITAN